MGVNGRWWIMARKDALLKLHRRLVARRDELLRSIQDDLGDLRHELWSRAGSEDGDIAADSITTEMTSQLAELEARELRSIERALERLRHGAYGTCENCGKKIPVARLNALPYATVCVECQRHMEAASEAGPVLDSRWQKIYETETTNAARDMTVNLSDLEMNLG
jgi:DnaK suppressor protein